MDSSKRHTTTEISGYVRFPEVHNIEVKKVGKAAACESIKAILMQRRDHSGRLRRMWISSRGQQPTAEEQMLVWPSVISAMKKAISWDGKGN